MRDTTETEGKFGPAPAYENEASQIIPGSVNSNIRLAGFPFPLCFEGGEGAYLYDLDGYRFIDGVLGMGPTVLGHAPPAVWSARRIRCRSPCSSRSSRPIVPKHLMAEPRTEAIAKLRAERFCEGSSWVALVGSRTTQAVSVAASQNSNRPS